MSVHNVGFTITDFTSVELRDHFNIDIKVSRWARENLIQRSRRDIIMIPSATFLYTLALELDVDYPLSKMDIVVMPGYPVPTMECWGLVFWDEDYMVENSKMFQRFNVDILSIVANQMVRQWFGNLVTVKSWTDIWFFDGFNKYLTERLTEHEAPELQEKITQNIISVFNFDAMNISHAVSCIK